MTVPRFNDVMSPTYGQSNSNDIAPSSGKVISFDEVMGVKPPSLLQKLGLVATDEEQEERKRQAERVLNRVNNIGKLVGAANDLVMNRPVNSEVITAYAQSLQNDVLEGESPIDRALSDVGHMFSKASIKETVAGLWDATKERFSSKKMETLKAIGSLPANIVDSIVGDTFNAVTGIDLSEKEIKPLDFNTKVSSTKTTLANVAAAVVAPVASKMLTAATELEATRALGGALNSEAIASAPLGNVAKLATVEPTLGAIGRAIVSDAGAATAAGMTQGAVAGANTKDVYSQIATGMLFAPIGVITGWYRGVKNGGIGSIEAAVTEAHDVAMLRQWQEIGDANVQGVAKKVENLLTSDNIEQALSKEITDATVHKPAPPTEINSLYAEFEKTLEDGKSFELSLVEFLEKKKLTEHTNEILHKFSTKYVEGAPEEYNHLQKLIKDHSSTEDAPFFGAENDILDAASRRGMYVTNEFGLLKIRDIESGEVVGKAKTSSEAIKMMNDMGDAANPVLPDSGAEVPTNGVGSPIAPSHSIHIADHFEPTRSKWSLKSGQIDLALNPITGMNAHVEAIDRYNWGTVDAPRYTNFKYNVFEPLERAHRLTNNTIRDNLNSGVIKQLEGMVRTKLDKFGKGGKFSAEQLEQVAMLREAQSIDEIMTPNGYSNGFTVSPDALETAKFANENGVDYTKILQYRRVQAAVKAEFTQRAHVSAMEKMQQNKKTGMSTAEAAEIYDTDSAAWEKAPEWQNIQQEIINKYQPDAKFLKVVEMTENLFKKPDGAANSAAVARLKLALDHPDTHGLTRDQFAIQHKLTPDQLNVAKVIDRAYMEFGTKFGIADGRMLMRYMNHYRQWADLLDTDILSEFEAGIKDGAMKQFASAMIRTGEVSNYSMDPIQNLYSYIRGGTKAQHLYPAINDVFGIDGAYRKEIAKLTDPVMKETVNKRFNAYQKDIVGQHSLGITEAQHSLAHYYRNLLGDNATAKDIVAKMDKPDHLDTLMNLQSASYLGGRVSLALRDRFDTIQKFFTKHGTERTKSLLAQKATKLDIERLVLEGEIVRPDPIDVYNTTYSQSNYGTLKGANVGVHNLAKELADIGFKASLQGYNYMKAQAAVYIHTTKFVNSVLKELSADKITKEIAYKKIGLGKYEPSTQQIFDAYVRDGGSESAARLLAREDTREMVGVFTRGNQAPVLNTKPGKLFGQLGSWGMTNRSVLQNLLTRGSKEEIRGSMLRYASSIVATSLAGRAMGLNLGRWMLLPTSLVATGGPLLNTAQAVQSELSSELGGSGAQTHFTRIAAQRSLMGFVPYSYAARDVGKAADLANKGSGYGARVPAQALGIPVNKEDRTMLDWIMGNYPIPPQ